MNLKWLFALTLCTFALGLTLLHAQSQPQSAVPAPEQGQSIAGDDTFFLQFETPVPPPDSAADVVYFYGPGLPGDAAGPEFDIADAGPVTAPLPFLLPDPQR